MFVNGAVRLGPPVKFINCAIITNFLSIIVFVIVRIWLIRVKDSVFEIVFGVILLVLLFPIKVGYFITNHPKV